MLLACPRLTPMLHLQACATRFKRARPVQASLRASNPGTHAALNQLGTKFASSRGSFVAFQTKKQRVARPSTTALSYGTAADTLVTGNGTKHRFWTSQGTIIDCTVEQIDQSYIVSIEIDRSDSKSAPETPYLHWGMYRATPAKWNHPKDVLPPGSELDAATGAMRTPFTPEDDTPHRWHCQMTVPLKVAPLQLGMVLYFPGEAPKAAPRQHQHCLPCQHTGLWASTPLLRPLPPETGLTINTPCTPQASSSMMAQRVAGTSQCQWAWPRVALYLWAPHCWRCRKALLVGSPPVPSTLQSSHATPRPCRCASCAALAPASR